MERRYEIKYSNFLMIILIFVLMPPTYFLKFNFFESVNHVLVIFLFVILLINNIIKKKINLYLVLIGLFFLFNMFTSYFLLEGKLDLYNSLRIISTILLINLLVNNHVLSLFRAYAIVFYLYITLNFLSYIIFPSGLYLDNPRDGQYREAWFLGIENQFAYYIIPGLVLIMVYDFYLNRKLTIRSFSVYIISMITIFLASSATAIVSLLFLTFSLLIIKGKISRITYSFFTLFSIYVILWFITIRINTSKFFRGFIENILEKDMTLSSRTIIWERVFEYISASKWIGHGNNTYVAFTNKEFRSHNLILQIVLDNGLIGLSIFMLILVIVGMKLKKTKYLITSLIIVGIFSVLIGGLAEAYRLNNLFVLLTLGYFNVDIIKKFIDFHQLNSVEGYRYG